MQKARTLTGSSKGIGSKVYGKKFDTGDVPQQSGNGPRAEDDIPMSRNGKSARTSEPVRGKYDGPHRNSYGNAAHQNIDFYNKAKPGGEHGSGVYRPDTHMGADLTSQQALADGFLRPRTKPEEEI